MGDLLLVYFNLNCVAVYFGFMSHRRLSGWHAGHTAATHVEFRPVARTSDLKTFKTPVAERSPVVGADVVNAKVAVADLE